jgi:hypothetical protein
MPVPCTPPNIVAKQIIDSCEAAFPAHRGDCNQFVKAALGPFLVDNYFGVLDADGIVGKLKQVGEGWTCSRKIVDAIGAAKAGHVVIAGMTSAALARSITATSRWWSAAMRLEMCPSVMPVRWIIRRPKSMAASFRKLSPRRWSTAKRSITTSNRRIASRRREETRRFGRNRYPRQTNKLHPGLGPTPKYRWSLAAGQSMLGAVVV